MNGEKKATSKKLKNHKIVYPAHGSDMNRLDPDLTRFIIDQSRPVSKRATRAN